MFWNQERIWMVSFPVYQSCKTEKYLAFQGRPWVYTFTGLVKSLSEGLDNSCGLPCAWSTQLVGTPAPLEPKGLCVNVQGPRDDGGCSGHLNLSFPFREECYLTRILVRKHIVFEIHVPQSKAVPYLWCFEMLSPGPQTCYLAEITGTPDPAASFQC